MLRELNISPFIFSRNGVKDRARHISCLPVQKEEEMMLFS